MPAAAPSSLCPSLAITPNERGGATRILVSACAYPLSQTQLDHLSFLKSLSLPLNPPKSLQEIARNCSLPIWPGSRLGAGHGTVEWKTNLLPPYPGRPSFQNTYMSTFVRPIIWHDNLTSLDKSRLLYHLCNK